MAFVTIVTVSDRCSVGKAQDTAGDALARLVTDYFSLKEHDDRLQRVCVPDEKSLIQGAIVHANQRQTGKNDRVLVITTGGTGCTSRDVTPEAVSPLLAKSLAGVNTLLTVKSIDKTPLAALSRFTCGVTELGAVILTFPGSEKACRECFGFISPILSHLLDCATDLQTPVAVVHADLQSSDKQDRSCSNRDGSHAVTASTHSCKHTHNTPQHDSSCPKGSISSSSTSKTTTTVRTKEKGYSVADRPRKSPWPMQSVDAAEAVLLAFARMQMIRRRQTSTCSVPLHEAVGLVLAEDVAAPEPHPQFPASVKDGYAVKAEDCPGKLIVDQSIVAGHSSSTLLQCRHAARITTGAPVPRGADAVVQVEDTILEAKTEDGQEEASIRVLTNVTQGQDIRPVGFDFSKGEVLLQAGDILGPAELGLLATVGITHVSIISKPIVGIVSTGDELVGFQEADLKYGQVRDSNREALRATLVRSGVKVNDYGIISDSKDDLYNTFTRMVAECDIIVSSGGVSMGERDLIKGTIVELGGTVHFGRVQMKPGKPTTFATLQRPGTDDYIGFFGLPGNPVSCLVTFHIFVSVVLRALSGVLEPGHKKIAVRVDSDIRLDARLEFQRAMLLPAKVTTGSQCSSRLLSMRTAHVLLILPPFTNDRPIIHSGEIVSAIPYEM